MLNTQTPHGCRLFRRRSALSIDLHGGRHSCRKHHALRHLINMDAHGDALRQAHPGKDRVDVGEPLPIGLRVGDVDAAGDARFRCG